jgi:hypothetical protein
MVTTALIILLLCFAVSRLITSRSVSGLSVDQKATLVDASVSKRPWFFVALAALLVVWALASANFGHRDWLFVAFVIVLLALTFRPSSFAFGDCLRLDCPRLTYGAHV